MRLSIGIAVVASFFALTFTSCKPGTDGGGTPGQPTDAPSERSAVSAEGCSAHA
jgi:hypothetical protein